jgi:hypothetical protein
MVIFGDHPEDRNRKVKVDDNLESVKPLPRPGIARICKKKPPGE